MIKEVSRKAYLLFFSLVFGRSFVYDVDISLNAKHLNVLNIPDQLNSFVVGGIGIGIGFG